MDDRALGRALLRLTLGINLVVHGLVRVPKLSAFAAGMARDFQPTILPSGLVQAFALALPFAEAAVGALITVGLFHTPRRAPIWPPRSRPGIPAARR